MHRKRALGICTLGLLAVSAAPASAGQSMQVVGPGEATILLDVVDAPLVVVSKAADPIIDQGVEGVGHLLVDADQEEMSLTIGVKVEPLGIDETIKVGGAEEPAEEPAPVDQGTEASDVESAQQVQRLEQVKQKAAAEAAAAASSAPAFATGRSGESITGSVALGSGVTESVRPTTAPSGIGNQATGVLQDASNGNAWLQLMGVLVLAGTTTAWSVAQRHGLA